MKGAIIVGYGTALLEAARRAVAEEGLASYIEVAAPEEFDEAVDVAVLYTPSVPRSLHLREARIIAPASEEVAGLARGPPDIVSRLAEYLRRGGEENLRRLARYIAYLLGVAKEPPPPPLEVPFHGVWHPRLGVYRDVREFLGEYGGWRGYVGILFYRNWWLYGNTRPVEALVEELEGRGLGAVPVFTTGHRGPLGEPSAEDTIRELLAPGGEPVVDVVIDMLSFLLLDRRGEGVRLLKRLGVPVLKAVRDSRQSVEEWLSSAGISPTSLIYEVVMPELDGIVEPVFLAGSRRMQGWRLLEAYREHAAYIASRASSWVRLRRKPPGERRVVLVLNNPPCKLLEATVGVALGLDALETVVRILHRLREAGYRVEGRLPRSGQELADMILERRALSEFRWTRPSDTVERGGCLALVPVEKYMEWFMELPEEKRREMLEWWGDPRNPSGPLAAALYKGCFVVPGLRFGNVVVMPQPKFGCAGPACDGSVCKILHNPRVPPPHQWLAVYRWVTRVFDADVVVHVGTHGSLEFRPGKRVGLSPLCWPEITIDDKPFLYIYAVTNPMEAVVAKRRGYAVIVDHVHPPLELRLTGLEGLEEALEEYMEAERKGDLARSREAYRRMMEEARRAGIPLPRGLEGREAAEEIHRFLDRARSSMVEHGLHVFGEVGPAEAASTALTILERMPGSPSPVKTLAAWMEGRGACSGRDCLSKAFEAARRVLEEMLRRGVKPGEVTAGLLETLLTQATSG